MGVQHDNHSHLGIKAYLQIFVSMFECGTDSGAKQDWDKRLNLIQI